ncbi:phage head spike fiber domain-containing protein [Aeromonas caviae]|uniref:phage head spike fiber domain-containing protein n=1 Tax=Aeromonas caviae TaxID=648 RepID=UPI002B4A68F0|nr:hypothetical protein [Aeromonas caviae]
MAGLWPRTGNVTVTNGSKIVTGFGTKWKTGTLPIQKGHTFYGPDNFAYEVDTVVSDESLTLVEAYRGGTLANQGYRIDITRTSTISQFAADLASLVAKYRAWFDGMMTWLTGSGDVAILNPDTGANVTIPSWKKVASEGEGQTARAKVEADRAKTEADRALTEAGRAAGIVAAAALPLPDVWAPLSDSLRLITGYGRDVLVGSDVVARMVNFSRNSTATYIGKDGQLKTAAANEPRFEKEGLLIEGQSTNLVPRGSLRISAVGGVEGWSLSGAAGVTNSVSEVVDPRYGTLVRFGVGVSRTAYVLQSLGGFEVGATYTISAHCPHDDTGLPIMRVLDKALTYSRVGDRVFATFVAEATSLAFQIGKGVMAGTTTLESSVVMGNIQIEKLPFASSYIPTNGAASTRVADIVTLPRLPNMGGGLTTGLTVAITFNKIGFEQQLANYVLSLIDIANDDRYGIATHNSMDELYIFDAFGISFSGQVRKTRNTPLVLCLGPAGTRGFCINGVYKQSTAGDPKPRDVIAGDIRLGFRVSGSQAWGHVRDFRIWRKELTAEQNRAIA